MNIPGQDYSNVTQAYNCIKPSYTKGYIRQSMNMPTRLKPLKKFDVGGSIVAEDERLSTLHKYFDEKTLKRVGVIECQTCANRTYQDESDDASVSFQTPTQLSPNEAASAVRAHEQEHVVNEQNNAQNEGKEVLSQSVQIHTSICPECGITYVSGGLTTTTTASDAGEKYSGANFDTFFKGNLVDYKL